MVIVGGACSRHHGDVGEWVPPLRSPPGEKVGASGCGRKGKFV
jgi:hypothetical protein